MEVSCDSQNSIKTYFRTECIVISGTKPRFRLKSTSSSPQPIVGSKKPLKQQIIHLFLLPARRRLFFCVFGTLNSISLYSEPISKVDFQNFVMYPQNFRRTQKKHCSSTTIASKSTITASAGGLGLNSH